MASYERLLKKLNEITFLPPKKDDRIKISDKENCKLSVLFWSDLHVSDYLIDRTNQIRISALDIEAAEDTVDLLTFGGDLTENGKEAEYRFLADTFRKLGKVRHILPVTGNHDVRIRRFSGTVKRFCDFCKTVNPELNVEKLWFSYEVNGYPFLVLGSVSGQFEKADLSEEELLWLSETLKNAAKGGKPVFVLLHQPLKLTHNLPHSWDAPGADAGSVGPQSDRIRLILEKYKNVFLITGHLHRGFYIHTFEEMNQIHLVNLPSTGDWNKDSVYSDPGLGLMMEVYEDRVLFRPRDFLHGAFAAEYNKTYILEK